MLANTEINYISNWMKNSKQVKDFILIFSLYNIKYSNKEKLINRIIHNYTNNLKQFKMKS
jgi:hypothetical protein